MLLSPISIERSPFLDAIRSGAGLGRLKSLAKTTKEDYQEILSALSERGNGVLTAWWIGKIKNDAPESFWEEAPRLLFDGEWSVLATKEMFKNDKAIVSLLNKHMTCLLFKLSMLRTEQKGRSEMAAISSAFIVEALLKKKENESAEKVCEALSVGMGGVEGWATEWIKAAPKRTEPLLRNFIEREAQEWRKSLLCHAAANGEMWRLKLALDCGGQIDFIERGGRGAIEILMEFSEDSRQGGCAKKKRQESVSFLIKAGVPTINKKTRGNILHWMSFSPSLTEAVEIKKEWLHEKDFEGNTPLHLAATKRNTKVFGWLLERGASILAQNKNGETPLEKASPECRRLFREWEAKKLSECIGTGEGDSKGRRGRGI